MVDDEDFDFLSRYTWTFCRRYAYRYRRSTCNQPMHRLIMEHHGVEIAGKEVDHINGNGLDNQKTNLRPVTRSQNTVNRSELADTNTSGFNGCNWSDRHQSWEATLGVRRKTLFGGYHETKEEAAIAYNILAIKHFGEYAFVNYFPFTRELLMSVLSGMNNSKKYRAGTSRYKGVCRDGNRWAAQLTLNREVHWIGSFTDEREAAIAFDRFVMSKGAVRRINFIYNQNGEVVGEDTLFDEGLYLYLFDRGGFESQKNYISLIRAYATFGLSANRDSA